LFEIANNHAWRSAVFAVLLDVLIDIPFWIAGTATIELDEKNRNSVIGSTLEILAVQKGILQGMSASVRFKTRMETLLVDVIYVVPNSWEAFTIGFSLFWQQWIPY